MFKQFVSFVLLVVVATSCEQSVTSTEQSAKPPDVRIDDEFRAENDYQVNLKAEMEVETILTHLQNQNNLMLEILRRIEDLEKRELQLMGKN